MAKLQSRLYRAPAQKSPARELFLGLGEDERVSRVLAALVDLGTATATDVVRHSGYVYGTIVKTLQEIAERDWVSTEEIPSSKRGRNPVAYTLTVSKTALDRYYSKRIRERLAALAALRD